MAETPPSTSRRDHFEHDVLIDRSYEPQHEKSFSSSEDAGSSKSRSNERARKVFSDWWWELLACVPIIASFSGLIAILRAYQDRPLPKWPLGLSFNTALSVLGLVFRTPALFIAAEGIGQLKWRWFSKERPLSDLSAYDEATRGPWGSTKLLWVTRWRDLLAIIGSIIIIASIGIDPFTQAVVGYSPCRVSATKSASTVGRINSFFSFFWHEIEEGVPPWTRLAMAASIQNSNSLTPNYSCTAAHCTFTKPYHSIGFCSKCVDVTDELITEDWSNEDWRGRNYTLPRLDPQASVPLSGSQAGYRFDLRGEEVRDYALWDVLSVRKFAEGFTFPKDVLPSETEGRHQSSRFDIVSARPILGSRCYLSYCIRSYTGTINHGVLVEKLESTSRNWSTWSAGTPIVRTVETNCLRPQVRRKLESEGYISADTEWMAWNGTYFSGTEADEGISRSTERAIPIPCVYEIQVYDDAVNWAPYEFYTGDLAGSVRGNNISSTRMRILHGSTGFLAGLYDDGAISIDSINHVFDNVTTVISNYMRTQSRPIPANISEYDSPLNPSEAKNITNPNPVIGEPKDWNHPTEGNDFNDTTCIRVRWPWLALPAAIIVGTLGFLIILITTMTFQDERGMWKSSQNALMWHGLSGPAVEESASLNSRQDMDARAEEIRVHLSKTDRGWKLVQDERLE
ncbi:hypothetical protein BU24DRAFT_419239 [Aaosphaeria arxii CBS 175.79]|uniref:Uncharacterized protein n=1 Tax=Aaosphaeria arxii CBS 175.79 TaxID=1450172 RepID=A0A6A5Y3L6_9PLEO|nr:uncharacterized protein BU24DRAFT_419239 [Aaosphaeria arxii CBS 175.79]KAF2019627.1 hypothetical protein BU24DRAFT_419239 [Aaosphaeria arxii CBS 175.79]